MFLGPSKVNLPGRGPGEQAPSRPTDAGVLVVLANSPLLTTLTREQIAQVLRCARHRTYQPGQVLMRQGEPGDSRCPSWRQRRPGATNDGIAGAVRGDW
ncbi:MAG: hypothetical protein CL878_15085 [Dehalococcoidia bacterium]|nr:hypothetical protein [Dehalococcoidia bacterium]